MANILTIPPNGTRIGDGQKIIRYNVTLIGTYTQHVRGTSVGEVLNLDGAINQGFCQDAVWGGKGPDSVYLLNIGAGYILDICPGADASHPLLVIYLFSGAELGQGAAYASGTIPLASDLDMYIEAVGRSFD